MIKEMQFSIFRNNSIKIRVVKEKRKTAIPGSAIDVE